jgi:hypothetical protein
LSYSLIAMPSMNSALSTLPSRGLPIRAADIRDEDVSILTVANALLACHARGADAPTMLTICERLLTVTERELLKRERRMMADGDPDLAAHVRRHGDLLLAIGRQVRDCRREATPLPAPFIKFVGSMAERIGTLNSEAA